LVIGDSAFAVRLKSAEDGTNFIYIDDEGKEFPVRDEKDIVVFLSKKSGLKPEILPDATVFDSVDKMDREIREITGRIKENVSEETKEEDLIKSMGFDDAIGSLEGRPEAREGDREAAEAGVLAARQLLRGRLGPDEP
jgi:hypothetical protein